MQHRVLEIVCVLCIVACAAELPRSILQACRTETSRLCDVHLDAMQCLVQQRSKIADVQCLLWLEARDACVRDARRKCGNGGSYVECLGQLTDADLTQPCIGSSYLKSMRLASSRWSRQRLRKGQS